jgi:hypothetical protein
LFTQYGSLFTGWGLILNLRKLNEIYQNIKIIKWHIFTLSLVIEGIAVKVFNTVVNLQKKYLINKNVFFENCRNVQK